MQDAFTEAVGLPTMARIALLARLRGEDPALADEVESLLGFHAKIGAGDGRDDEPATASMPGSLLGTTVGGCRIERLVGYGGMSAVYAATQDFPRRRVAVKIVRRERMSASARRRLRVEAEALARLQHPNIARVYAAGSAVLGPNRMLDGVADASTSDDSALGKGNAPNDALRADELTPASQESPYIVMELVEDAAPVTRWADARKLDPLARIDLVARIADAIGHAHRAGVIHRDLKPGNVIVGTDGSPKVIDFGIAAVIDSTVTAATEGPMGTLAYMSPEQARGAAVDTRSDIWGLGALLYDLLAGCPPFDTREASLAAHLDRLLHDTPASLETAARAARSPEFIELLPDAADAVVRKALATDPDRRYRSAGEFADELRRLVHGEPLLARPDSDWDGLMRLLSRHRASLAASAGIATAVVVGLVVSLALLKREREAFARAEWAAYLASIAAASGMLDRSDASAAVEMLEQSPPEHRGWEWQYLSARAAQPLWSVDFATGQQVYGLDYSPDGRTLFAAASGLAVSIDTAAGTARWKHESEGKEPYWRVKALADGGAVFVRMTERLERRAADGTIEARADDRNILDVAVDGTRTRIFTNALHGFAERDRDSLELLREVEADPPLKAIPRAIAVSPDASRVVLGDRLGHLTALDAGTGRVAWSHAVPGEPIELRGVAVSPDGTLAAGVGGAHILVVELATGALVWSANTSGRVFRAPSFSADSRELLAATWVESVDRFDARTGRALGQATGVFSQVWATAAAPGGDAFAAGGLSARTVVFPADASIAPTAIALDGSPVTSIALGRRDTEGTLFAVTGSGALHAIDRASRRSRRVDCGLAASAVRVDGLGRVLLAHSGGIAWLDRDGRIESKAEIPQAAQRITVLDDEHILAICGEDASSSKAYLVRRDARSAEHTLFPLPDRGIACGGAAPGAEPGVHYIPSGNAREALALRVRDRDGSPLAAAEFREILDQPELPRVAALSPDRTLLAVGSVLSKGEVAFLDPRTWRTLRLMPNHRGSARALAWSPDGTRLASCATDDTVRIWHRERAVEILVAWRGACADLAWADDGELWLACGDGCVRVLALPHAR